MNPKISGMGFNLKVWTTRWRRYDTYTLKVTKSGWYVSNLSIKGDCKKDGSPYLFKNLDQDSVSYPSDLDSVMENLWRKIDIENLTVKQINHSLKRISLWLWKVETGKPTFNLTKKGIKKVYRVRK